MYVTSEQTRIVLYVTLKIVRCKEQQNEAHRTNT